MVVVIEKTRKWGDSSITGLGRKWATLTCFFPTSFFKVKFCLCSFKPQLPHEAKIVNLPIALSMFASRGQEIMQNPKAED